VVQWLLLDRIDTEPTGASISGKDYLIIAAGPDKTESLLTLPQLTVVGANITLNPPTINRVPIFGRE
jgi:hypothetical protein